MGDIPVAFPAGSVRTIGCMVCDKGFHFGIGHLVLMASDAIGLNDFDGRLSGSDDLRLSSHGKYRGVIESVFGFEEIFVSYVVMGYMAVIAAGYFPMGAVSPGDVLGLHDMAIDTGLGIVGEVGGGIGKIKQEKPQAYDDGHYKSGYRSPLSGRYQTLFEEESLKSLR